jgi:flagellar hook assembly protein FlgD
LSRFLPAALVLVLLVATGSAFVYAESLKLEPSPILSVKVDSLISPTCDCGPARVAFKLRKKDVVTVSILDSDGREVRRLATERPVPRRRVLGFFWNGRIAGAQPAPEGEYRAQVRLELLEKTITLPNEIRVDTTRPRVTVTATGPRRISPDGDRRSDSVTVAYVVDEPARVALLANGVQRVQSGLRRRGRLTWYGRVDGHTVPAGNYRLTLVATDEAGNRSRPVRAGTVRVRYIALAKDEVTVRPRALVRVRVSTDATSYRWRFAGDGGETRVRRLELRAPKRPGRYALFVAANGHGDRMTVVVRKPPKP